MGAGAPEGEAIPGEEMPAGDDLEGPAAADVADSEEIDLEELLKEIVTIDKGAISTQNIDNQITDLQKEQKLNLEFLSANILSFPNFFTLSFPFSISLSIASTMTSANSILNVFAFIPIKSNN